MHVYTVPARPQRVADARVASRVFNACWLSASLGLSILQMRLLAQVWQVSHLALASASLMSLWTLGALVGSRLPNTQRLWGLATLGGALLWLGSPSLVMWRLPANLVSPLWLMLVPLALVAVLLGACSSAWLTKRRALTSPGERTMLVRNLLGLTTGLLIVWMLPDWASPLGLLCCLPLLLFDARSARRNPLPIQRDVAVAWMSRYWRGERTGQLEQLGQPPLQMERRALRTKEQWAWLVERSRSCRGYLPLTLLASGVAVMLGCVWGAVPTPFAAGLVVTHTLEKLCWLLAGQIIVVLIGAGLLGFAARGVLGFPDRLIPTAWQARARWLLGVALVGMAAGLMALGLPLLQASWWLALSLSGYTLSSAVWGLLLPRMRPAYAVQVQALRHLLLGKGEAIPTTLELAHAGACEAQVNHRLTALEGVLVALLTPLVGWFIDVRGSVDPALVIIGLGFLCALLLGGTVAALLSLYRRRRHPHRVVAYGRRYIAHTAHPVSSRLVRAAW